MRYSIKKVLEVSQTHIYIYIYIYIGERERERKKLMDALRILIYEIFLETFYGERKK